jgi:hypothetical protein
MMEKIVFIITFILSLIYNYYFNKNKSNKERIQSIITQALVIVFGSFFLGLDHSYSYYNILTIIFCIALFFGNLIAYIISKFMKIIRKIKI